MTTLNPKSLLKYIEKEKKRRRLLGSFREFVKEYWTVIEPFNPYKSNWHIDAIIEHLEAVRKGVIKNLLINVPPGTSKSTLVSVMFPAWCWAHDQSARFLGASYSEPLAIRDTLLCREIITHPDYTDLFPEVTVKKSENQKTHYGLDGGGWRMATSVGGRGTGMHPNYKIIDDPHNVKESESDVERQAALDWYDGTMSSRGVILDASTIVIMQRLHQKDLSGHIMSGENYRNWSHLVIPMEYEPASSLGKSQIGFKDPRVAEGELLWPEVFTKGKVKELKVQLGNYRAAGQLQQRPAPAGGGILNRDEVRLWRKEWPMPVLEFVLQSYDTAFTEHTDGDPSACTVWGVFTHGGKRNILLLEAWAEHLGYPALRRKLMDDWKAKYGGNPKDPLNPARRADVVLVEKKASGQSIIQDLRTTNAPVATYDPGRADKVARAHMAAPHLDNATVWVLESKKADRAGKPVAWAEKLLEQMEQFPNGEHDDMVDTFTQAIIYLRDAGQLELPAVPDEQPEEVDYVARRNARQPENVYSL